MSFMARVVLGVTGGIAAYKAAELARLLVKGGHEVTPILTGEAESFVTRKTFEALARREAPGELYPHLVNADLLVIAPLSANTLAKLAHGLADNVLTQTALAFEGPVLTAPAMNPRMWAHRATRENVAKLRERGVVLVGPDEGELAEGEWGVGRMSEPAEIMRRAQALLARADADVVVMAAAVADYRPAEPTAEKRPKDDEPWTVTLEPTADVLKALGDRRRDGQLLVGFAADRGEPGLARAREKLVAKKTDFIVFNDVSRGDIGFDATENEVVLVSSAGERRIRKARKERIAGEILDEIAHLMQTHHWKVH